MKKIFSFVLAMMLCAVLLTVFAEGPAVSGGTLVGAGYSCSGDELGNVYYASIVWTEDATPVLEIAESPAHDAVVTVRRYSAADDTLERIGAMVNENGMLAWSDRPDYWEVCDAAQPYLYFTVLTENGERVEYSISGYIDFSEDEAKLFHAVRDTILESEKADNLIETYQFARD